VLDLVEKLCTRVLVLDRGRVVADDSVDHLCSLQASASLEEVFGRLVRREEPDRLARDIADTVTAHA
jgi:ABC-2 type transport system ATP-binding protein